MGEHWSAGDQIAAAALECGAQIAPVEQDNHLAFSFGVSEASFTPVNTKYTPTGGQMMGKHTKALVRGAHR